MQPLNELFERIDRTGGQHEDAAIRLVGCITAQRQGAGALGSAGAEEHALHLPADADPTRSLWS